MKCNDISKLIIDKLAGELSPRQAGLLGKHLDACEACRKESEMLNKAWESSNKTLKEDTFADELTPARRSEIFAIAQNEVKRQKSSRLITRFVEYFAVIAICLILAGMMLPALNQAREKARDISMKSVAKQRKMDAIMKEMDAEEESKKDVIGEDEGEERFDDDGFAVRSELKVPMKKMKRKSVDKFSHSTFAAGNASAPVPILDSVEAPSNGERRGKYKKILSKDTQRHINKISARKHTQDMNQTAEVAWKMNMPVLPKLEKERVITKSISEAIVTADSISNKKQQGYYRRIKKPEIAMSYEVTSPEDRKNILKKNQLATLRNRYNDKNHKVKKIVSELKILRGKVAADISAPQSAPMPNQSRAMGRVLNRKIRVAACIAPPMAKETFKLNLKLWNMTTASNVKKYLKENKYPVPTNIKVNKYKNTITIHSSKVIVGKIKKLFKKLQNEEKELKDLSKGLPFIKCLSRPISTFSIDTDTASYVQARKSIRRGDRPNPLKIRPEEFINYFDYNYRSPLNATFAVYPEAAPSPFRPNNTLFRIGIQGKRLGPDANTRTHYTILLDTSGSMAVKDRMELAKKALAMMLKKLKPTDYVSLLLCGNKTKVVFRMRALTHENRQRLLRILNSVSPRSVADFANGISKAYAFADRYYLRNSSNRIIIISDGIFELGDSGRQSITTQIEAARKRGISNIVIGLGGDGDDNMLEKVASTGDGSYVFLDTEREAKELFSTQFEARFREIARDVKIQVQFNLEAVKSYRQIGYKNRQLSKADFRNDKVDAGEVGSGQAVTALYELKLKDNIPKDTIVATIRIRYKKAGDMSVEEKAFYLYESDIKEKFNNSSPNLKLASFVAEFAESLRYPETQNIASLRGVADKLNCTWMKHYKKDHKVTELLSLIKRSR
jgi:Uncharacterized protein YfbK, C-terminal/von Willebrand factor/von Willebrand factor type A domain/Putative zinc-finger